MAEDGTGGELLTLQEAADRLKVHYMTAYRWVRRGELRAFKAGGRLRVRAADLTAFLGDRTVDVALPAERVRRTDWPIHIERLHDLLLAGRGVEAASLVRKVVADGASAGDVYVRLIAPTLHRIGDDWSTGGCSVAQEHRASEIVSALLVRLGDHFRRRGPSRGTAVTMTPPGQTHGLGAAMVADFLRAAGVDVHHLGVNVPLEELSDFLQQVPADIIGVSLTTPGVDDQVYEGLVAAARQGSRAVVVVGGQAADPDAATAAGAVYVGDLAQLPRRLEQLLGA